MILAEAMASRKPVVCSRIGGLPEIVEDGTSRACWRHRAIRADLAGKRFPGICGIRPDLCAKMGQAGRDKARREYSSDRYYPNGLIGGV